MSQRKNIKMSRAEALKYLFLESPVWAGIVSSCISTLIVFVIIFTILYLGKFIMFTTDILLITGGVFMIFGVVHYFLKKKEFQLYETTSSDIFLNDIFSYPLELVVFAVVFSYAFVPQWIAMTKDNTVANIVITIFIVSLMFSYIYNALWKFFNFHLLGIIAQKDWYIMAEKDYFISVLGLRFEEAKRYSVPLSVVTIRFVDIKNKRLLDFIYNKISISLREIDTICHFNATNNFYMLSPITNIAAQGLLQRILRNTREFLGAKGITDKIKVECGISSVVPESQTEYDLLEHQVKTTEEITGDKID